MTPDLQEENVQNTTKLAQGLVNKLEGITEESKKQTAANKALEREKADLSSTVQALTEECSKAVIAHEALVREKEQLTLRVERLKQDCTRETAANKALESDKQELVHKLEVMTEESKKEVAAYSLTFSFLFIFYSAPGFISFGSFFFVRTVPLSRLSLSRSLSPG
jgi:predicted RNase H-like nuclease (RuvC/YqgF family)